MVEPPFVKLKEKALLHLVFPIYLWPPNVIARQPQNCVKLSISSDDCSIL